MPDYHSEPTVRERARETLKKLYSLITEANGQPPDIEEFFPVNLSRVVTFVLGWQLERVAEIGWSDGERLSGRCEHDKKRILIGVDVVRGQGEDNFTLAHEIGHAIMHRSAPCAHGGANRVRSIRRITVSSPPSDERRMEREAQIFASELLMPEKTVRNQFSKIFDCQSMWMQSSRIRYFMPKQPLGETFEPADVALHLAGYKKDTARSLIEFFGVSKGAMKVRLLELGLVY